MAILIATDVPVDGGVTLSGAAASVGGDEAPVGDNLFFYMANGDVGAHTATLVTSRDVDGLPIADAQLVVAAGAAGVIPLTNIFAGVNGRASITYDAVTSVTVAVFKLED